MRNQEKRNAIAKQIQVVGKYYSKHLEQDVVSMMVDDLEDLDQTAVVEAYGAYRRDPRNKTFPLPAQIRDIVSPQVTIKSQARDIPDRIKYAIKAFGYMREAEARSYVGEVGWSIIRQNGGWNSVCCDSWNNLFGDSARHAQIRDRAEDLITHGTDFCDRQIRLEIEQADKTIARIGTIDLKTGIENTDF